MTTHATSAAPSDSSRSAVLITGASSGIGYEIATRLAREKRFHVYAAVRKQNDYSRLLALNLDHLQPVFLDVQDDVTIREAAKQISADSRFPLMAIVNNAGLAVAGPLEFLKLQSIQNQFDVNVYGLLRVTQTFLPMIRTNRGRIINIGSISGRVTMPFTSIYSASKHAVKAINDGLRRELAPWGIQVSLIEPGMVRTPIWKSASNTTLEFLEDSPAICRELYGKSMHSLLADVNATLKSASVPDDVYKQVLHSLTAPQPKTRYLIGKDAKLAALMSHLPDRWFDRLLLRIRLKKSK